MHGYTGTSLRVNLTDASVTIEELDEELLRSCIGGRGLNSVRLLDETEAGMDPLSPESSIYFGVGPLTGTGLPASARFTITAKSPLTGIFGDSNAGGHWASELKFAGFDQIVVTGRSETPVMLFVDSGVVTIADASQIWGLGIRETTRRVKEELEAPDAQVLAIGPAGENGVKYACAAANLTRVCGRCGMGTVLGSKNLKAIALRGRGAVTVAQPKEFDRLCGQIEKRTEAHPAFGVRKLLGTTMLMTVLNNLGILPTRHFQEGVCEYADRISGEYFAEHFNVKDKSCFNCDVHCSRYYVTDKTQGEGPEYETLCSFTSKLGVDDAGFALRMNSLVNDAGLDSITACETIAWAFECAQRGIISSEDAGGLDLSWGNKETIETLISQIIRREGFGALLAEGVREAARQVGRGSEKYAFHVKGLEMICGDPRGLKAYGLTYAVATRGADHLHAEPYFELTGDKAGAKERFGHEEAADRLAWKGKAELVHWSERMALLTDCLTMCKNIGLCMDILSFPFAAELLRAGTGMDWDEQTVGDALDNVLAAEREFNRREGIAAEDDTLPERFLKEPLEEGPTAGSVVELDRMLEQYRKL
jgi:aldehyde:ferredoxin oxidoreductase